MPLIFRSMINNSGKPTVGTDSNMLGVRVPPHPRADVTPDEAGIVRPGSGGMSVAPSWRKLPIFLIPSRLKHLVAGARGADSLMCFQFGEGEFSDSSINSHLILRPNSATHGTVQPSRSMSLADFQQALADTRNSWTVIDEEAQS